MKRTGKIAQLPVLIREELNRRLEADEPASTLLPWLNAEDEVKDILEQNFDGKPISPQNLSEWRQGGFLEWRTKEDLLSDVRQLAEQAEEFSLSNEEPVVDDVATVLSARYASLLLEWDGEPNEKIEARVRILRSLCRDVVSLQRSIHQAEEFRQARDRREVEELEKELKKEKERAIAQISEPVDVANYALFYGGGERGAAIARAIYKIKHDLPPDAAPPQKPAPKPHPNPAPSRRRSGEGEKVAARKVHAQASASENPLPAPAQPAEPPQNPTQIKPNPTESNQIKPVATSVTKPKSDWIE
jgi:hypothetical protein